MTGRYHSASALRRALETRLKQEATDTGTDLARRRGCRTRWSKIAPGLGYPQVASRVKRRSPRIADTFVQTVPLDPRPGNFRLRGRRRKSARFFVRSTIEGGGAGRARSGAQHEDARHPDGGEYKDLGDQASAICHSDKEAGERGAVA